MDKSKLKNFIDENNSLKVNAKNYNKLINVIKLSSSVNASLCSSAKGKDHEEENKENNETVKYDDICKIV